MATEYNSRLARLIWCVQFFIQRKNMKNILFFLALFTATAAFGQTTYGEKTTKNGAIPASSITSKMKGLDSLAVKVIGTITSVCQNKGCWLMVDIGEEKMMRVRFKKTPFSFRKTSPAKRSCWMVKPSTAPPAWTAPALCDGCRQEQRRDRENHRAGSKSGLRGPQRDRHVMRKWFRGFLNSPAVNRHIQKLREMVVSPVVVADLPTASVIGV